MASRQEQKERLRKERQEREQAEKAAAARRKRLITLAAAAAAIVVVVIVVIVVSSSGGSKKKATVGQHTPNGLQISPGPWAPETAHLAQRLKALALPDPSDQVYHVHSQLNVYTDGKKQSVPANVGIDQSTQLLASLHTHDATGVIHQEAVQPYPFTLGQFFQVWGVVFTPTQLGGYHVGKGLVLQTYVNGKLVPNGPAYRLKSHDVIVVGFGDPGSFPKKADYKFPAGE